MINYSLILTLTLLSSCSYLVNSFEKDLLLENQITPKEKTLKTTCPASQKNILLNENKYSQEKFQKFLKNISKDHNFKFIDRTVLWSLVQINLRPDLSAPSAKLQVILSHNGEEKYFNSFSSDGDTYPYFYLLEHLLKKYQSRYSLSQLAQIYDSNIKTHFKVGEEFALFLSNNKTQLSENKLFSKLYLRGDETLKTNERLPRIKIKRLVKHYQKTKTNKDYQIKEFLFSYNANSSFIPKCNFDMNLYDSSIFLINKEKVQSNIFGLKNQDNAFLAISSQKLPDISPLNNSALFKGVAHARSASLCLFKNRFKPNNHLWLVSSNSRDPGQHLYHLLKYGIQDIKKISELDEMLKFSRHLFLKNPVRLIIESRRSDKQQVQELLKLSIPIYNAKSLGKIWGYFSHADQSSFVLDAREKGDLSCNSQ